MNSEIVLMVIMISLYRIVSLFVGLGFAYMGYKLFDHGVFDKAGDLQAAWGEKRLLLKQAAPGTFFSLFGTLIIVVALWKGISFDFNRANSDTSGNNTVFSSIGSKFDNPQDEPSDKKTKSDFSFGAEAGPAD